MIITPGGGLFCNVSGIFCIVSCSQSKQIVGVASALLQQVCVQTKQSVRTAESPKS